MDTKKQIFSPHLCSPLLITHRLVTPEAMEFARVIVVIAFGDGAFEAQGLVAIRAESHSRAAATPAGALLAKGFVAAAGTTEVHTSTAIRPAATVEAEGRVTLAVVAVEHAISLLPRGAFHTQSFVALVVGAVRHTLKALPPPARTLEAKLHLTGWPCKPRRKIHF